MQCFTLMSMPVRVVKLRHVKYIIGIGVGRISHPDPDDVVDLVNDIGGYTSRLRHIGLPWYTHTLTFAVECHAMVSALQIVTYQLAF